MECWEEQLLDGLQATASSPGENNKAAPTTVTPHLPEGCREVMVAPHPDYSTVTGVSHYAAPVGPNGPAGSSTLAGARNQIILDKAPKVLYQSEPLVEAVVKCNVQHYLEFKLVEGNYIYQKGALRPVLASKSDIFKDRSLSLSEKRSLMKFISDCVAAVAGGGPLQDDFDDAPLAALLQRQGLSPELQEVVMYGIAMCDVRQASAGLGSTAGETSQAGSSGSAAAEGGAPSTTAPHRFGVVTARQGRMALERCMESMGRYGGTGAFMVPEYGCGSLCEAFVRCAAVQGAVTVLRQRLRSLVVDHGNKCIGVVTAQGQVLTSTEQVVTNTGLQQRLAPHHTPTPVTPSPAVLGSQQGTDCQIQAAECTQASRAGGAGRVARAICLLDGSVLVGQSNTLLVFPPGSLPGQGDEVIRGLQLGPSARVVPPGRFLLYLNAVFPSGSHHTAEALLQPALQVLAKTSDLMSRRVGTSGPEQQAGACEHAGPTAADVSAETAAPQDSQTTVSDARPSVVQVIYYDSSSDDRAAPQGLPCNLACCCPPDGSLVGYCSAVEATEPLFGAHFTGLKWFKDMQVEQTGATGSDEQDVIDDLESALAGLASSSTTQE